MVHAVGSALRSLSGARRAVDPVTRALGAMIRAIAHAVRCGRALSWAGESAIRAAAGRNRLRRCPASVTSRSWRHGGRAGGRAAAADGDRLGRVVPRPVQVRRRRSRPKPCQHRYEWRIRHDRALTWDMRLPGMTEEECSVLAPALGSGMLHAGMRILAWCNACGIRQRLRATRANTGSASPRPRPRWVRVTPRSENIMTRLSAGRGGRQGF
jgi:hypothetical protein